MTLTDADKAYRQIKEKIITVQLPPGSLIREADLMAELGLGRTPIREALKKIQAENLVTVVPRRGMFVTDITITDLQQIYEVRVELERLCARLATERITPEQRAAMRELVAAMQTAHPADKEHLITLDRRFHHLLAEATGNKFLKTEFEHFYNLSLRIWHLALNRLQGADLDLSAHAEILSAIEAGDAERAARRMQAHIRHFHDTIKKYL
ncbi:MAG: GntR family transcriptional regulator [Caldilineae bacterium]|nr:MAG: GntR family transcriptional regulator [Caldilineae bacterium]